MSKTREDMLAFLEITGQRGIRLFSGLKLSDTSVFENGAREPDDELLSRFIRGGWLPSAEGSPEEGSAFQKKIERIDRGEL